MPTVTIGGNAANNFSGFEDAHLNSDNPDNNYDVDFSLVTTGRRPIIRVTGLSNIPPGSTLSDVKFWFFMTANSASIVFDIQRVLRAWVENQVTWNSWITSNAWTTAGATGAGDVAAASMTGVSFASGTGAYRSITANAGLLAEFQNIVNGTTNDGHLFVTTGGAGSCDWDSNEGATDGQRPYLEVTYTAAAAADPLIGRRIYVLP